MPPTWGSTWSPLSTIKPHRPLTTLLRGERRFIFRVILQGQGKNLRSNFDCLKAFASPLSIWWGRKSFFQCWSINFFLRNYDIFSNYVKWISCWVVLVQKSITMLWRWKIYLLSWSFPFYEWCLSILYLRKNGVLSLIRALLLSALQDSHPHICEHARRTNGLYRFLKTGRMPPTGDGDVLNNGASVLEGGRLKERSS